MKNDKVSFYDFKNRINAMYVHNVYNVNIVNLLKKYSEDNNLKVFTRKRTEEVFQWRTAISVVLIRQEYSLTNVSKILGRNHASILNGLRRYGYELEGFGKGISQKIKVLFHYLDKRCELMKDYKDDRQSWIKDNYPNIKVYDGQKEIDLSEILIRYEEMYKKRISYETQNKA